MHQTKSAALQNPTTVKFLNSGRWSAAAAAALFASLQDSFGNYIVRCSQVAAELFTPAGCVAGTPGDPIAYVDQGLANVGEIKTSGIDVSLNWSNDIGPGALSLNYRGTYVNEYEFQRFPGDAFISKLGVFIDGAPIIRYSHYATLSWDQGPWGAQL